MGRERDERATEAGVLAEVVQQAVEAKRARPQHFSVLLVRLLQPKDKPSASVMRAAAAKAASEARAAARAAGYGARQRPFMLRTEDGHGAPPAEPGNPVAASPVGIDRGAAGLAPRPPLPLRSLRTQKF